MNSNSGSQNNEANTVRFLIKSLNPESFVEDALCNPYSLNEKIEENDIIIKNKVNNNHLRKKIFQVEISNENDKKIIIDKL
jgi:hypothetical protein